MATQDEESMYANKTMPSRLGDVGTGKEASLHYATMDFSKLCGTVGEQGTDIIRGTQRTTDYAVIRHRSREEGGRGEEEGVEKEVPAELGAERETGEVRSGQEGELEGESLLNMNQQVSEEATYGNITRSRPTKRGQQENTAGGQEDMYVDVMSPLTEGENGKGVEESEYTEVRKLQ